jgi:hypothetical protein
MSDTLTPAPAAAYTFGTGVAWQEDQYGILRPADSTSGDTVTELGDGILLIGVSPFGDTSWADDLLGMPVTLGSSDPPASLLLGY